MTIRKTAAGAVLCGAWCAVAAMLGRYLRGPSADGIGRDFLTGSAVLGTVTAIEWAVRELNETSTDYG